MSLDCSSVSITDTGCLERICFRLVSSLLLAEEARGGERSYRRELRILEVMGLYSVDGKSKPP